MSRPLALALPALLVLAACSGPAATPPVDEPGGRPPTSGPAADPPRAFVVAAERWGEAGPGAYRMTLQRSCFCPPDWRGPFEVTVRDGSVVSATYEGEAVDAERVVTVEALLALLEDAYRRGAERVDAFYDPEFGYPTQFYVDYDARMADEEVGYEVTAFEPLGG